MKTTKAVATLVALFTVLDLEADAFSFSTLQSSSSKFISSTKTLLKNERSTVSNMNMFLDSFKSKKTEQVDTTKVGNLEVPTVGVGTIAWSSNSCKLHSASFFSEFIMQILIAFKTKQ